MLNLPGLTGVLARNTSALYATGVISVMLLGDYNNNGTVDSADYLVRRENVGAATLNNRDPNGMGAVGQADYDFWRAHFGNTAGSGSAAEVPAQSVPEPASCVLVFPIAIASPWLFRWH
jgi:hypothetical protein